MEFMKALLAMFVMVLANHTQCYYWPYLKSALKNNQKSLVFRRLSPLLTLVGSLIIFRSFSDYPDKFGFGRDASRQVYVRSTVVL
jgi:hypothetical protein